jgi:hypothetical protein
MAGTIVNSSVAKVAGAALMASAFLFVCTGAYGQQRNRADCVTRFHDGKRYVYCRSEKEKLRQWHRGPTPYARQKSAPPPPTVTIAPPRPAPSAPPPTISIAPPSSPARESAGVGGAGGEVAPPPSSHPSTTGSPKTNGSPKASGSRKASGTPKARAAKNGKLRAVRALIEPGDMPPREVAGYGIVAFTTRPLPHDVERYKAVCEAYKATLMAQSELPADTPLSEQMITYWPIAKKDTPEAQRGDCAHLVANYALRLGLEAIDDADKQKEGLANSRGPFLIAWAPSASRFVPDAVVLLVDLSSFDGQRTFAEVFQKWRQQITDNPELWKRGGFNVEAIRQIIRDTFDRYGDGLMRLITKS